MAKQKLNVVVFEESTTLSFNSDVVSITRRVGHANLGPSAALPRSTPGQPVVQQPQHGFRLDWGH